MAIVYQHIPHPHIAARRAQRPVKWPISSPGTRRSTGSTPRVGRSRSRRRSARMWCAYAFACST